MQGNEIKIAVIGEGGVGKSCCVIQFVQNVFVDEYDPTIEDNYRKQVCLDDETVLFDVFDTVGYDEWYHGGYDDYVYREYEGFIIMYSITNRNSFEEVERYLEKIMRVKDCEEDEIPIVIVGNKCDLEDRREVTTEEGKQLADSYHFPFFETSALQRINIEEMFYETGRRVLLGNFDFKINQLENQRKRLSFWSHQRKKNLDQKIKDAKFEKEKLKIDTTMKKLQDELNKVQFPKPFSVIISEPKLQQDLKKLFQNETNTDFTFTISNQEIKCHQFILKLRSNWMKKLIENSENNKIEIKENFEYFKKMVQFIYCGDIELEYINSLNFDQKNDFSILSKSYGLTELHELIENQNSENNDLEKKQKHISIKKKIYDTLILDLSKLFRNNLNIHKQKLNDIMFKFDDGNFIHLNQNILKSRSEYFEGLLNNEWKEKSGNEYKISWITFETFKCLSEYLYTDTIKFLEDKTQCLGELLAVSNQIHLPRLKEICEDTIQTFMDKEYVLTWYLDSELHLANQLKQVCKYYIQQPDW